MSEEILRHARSDRVFHWITAVAVLVLLGTAFLPIIGIKFPWVMTHWIAGLVLTLAVLFHIGHSLPWRRLRNMGFGPRDAREGLAAIARLLGRQGEERPRPGKYSPAQKLMHHAVAVLVLVTVATGLPMMAKVETPFWERNPYWLEESTWGVLYVLHGLAALFLLSVVMIHIYFALRPEKRPYLRAMLRGGMTREEAAREHDPQRWPGTDA